MPEHKEHDIQPPKEPKKQGKTDNLGLSSHFKHGKKRILNKDGSFNVKRKGSTVHIYHRLIEMSWRKFLLMVLLTYTAINYVFALAYYTIGVQHIHGIVRKGVIQDFLSAAYFSAQTMTTVGYGSMYPTNNAANTVASIEALVGLLCFALATGLVYGRFSRASPGLVFTEKALITENNGRRMLQMRVANKYDSHLMDVEARVLLTTVELVNNEARQRYQQLQLEYDRVHFLPLNWSITHIIDEHSPLHGVDEQLLKQQMAEVLVIVKGFDESFSQTIHARTSYTPDEMMWDKHYSVPYHIDEEGETIFKLDELEDYLEER